MLTPTSLPFLIVDTFDIHSSLSRLFYSKRGYIGSRLSQLNSSLKISTILLLHAVDNLLWSDVIVWPINVCCIPCSKVSDGSVYF